MKKIISLISAFAMMVSMTVVANAKIISGIKEAIIVSGKDVQNNEFEKPYLFVILEDNVDETKIMEELKIHIEQVLSEEERPADIFVIDKKPISRFKTDRQYLRDTYGL